MLHLLISGNKDKIHNDWGVMCNKPSEIVHIEIVSQEER